MTQKLITASNAAELLGVTTPTFYKLAEGNPLLAPVDSTGPKMWYLHNILEYLGRKDAEELQRRGDLLDKWNVKRAAEG